MRRRPAVAGCLERDPTGRSSAARLKAGAKDKALAAGLDSLAMALEKGEGDAVAKKRRSALGETLSGIVARLR